MVSVAFKKQIITVVAFYSPGFCSLQLKKFAKSSLFLFQDEIFVVALRKKAREARRRVTPRFWAIGSGTDLWQFYNVISSQVVFITLRLTEFESMPKVR